MGMMMWWMVVFWVVVIGGAAWAAAAIWGRRERGDASAVLRERLARGEIDVEEFNRRAAAIRGSETGSRSAVPWLIAAGVGTLAVFVMIPMIVMAANGWDMWDMDMHGRGRDTSGDAAVQGGAAARVRIEDFRFEPGNLEVSAGATVTWTNEDSAPHDATARNGDWQSDRLEKNESDSLTFDDAGVYDYYCSIHPSMKARLVVR